MNKPEINPELDLVLAERFVDVPIEAVWKAWTTPEQLMKWFCPRPWQTVHCEIDLRPGGRFRTVMRSPDGQESDSTGCYLDMVENEKLVFTSAMRPDFRPVSPSEQGLMMTAYILLEREGAGTRYSAIVMHGSKAQKEEHDNMGFSDGWSTALDQLVEMIKSEG